MFGRIRKWLALRKMSLARQMVYAWDHDSTKQLKCLRKSTRELKVLQSKLNVVSETVLEDLLESEKTISQHSHAMDTLRNEYDVLKNTTLPTLLAEARAIRERWDAEVATAVHRQHGIISDDKPIV